MATTGYMAPEQLRGAEVTAKSDIDAVGLVLYELSRVSGPATPIPFRPCYASRNCAIDGHDFDRRRYRSGRLYGAGKLEDLPQILVPLPRRHRRLPTPAAAR